MANNRKLQSELDRHIKKIEEGLDGFENTREKWYSATNPAHKEKYEVDLKKEIKKLQRLRETLKNWLAGNEFKDKSKIIEYKKKIERKMEQFKECERESKTKAYSREGLAKAGKLDPEEEKRINTQSWIQDTIRQLHAKIDYCEVLIEEEANKNEVRDLETRLGHHKWHVEKLELILRALDNEAVSPDSLEDLKDSIEYYLECGEEQDFMHDEEMYESLELDKEFTEKTVVLEAPPAKEKKKKKEKKEKKTKDRDSVSTRDKKEKKSAHDKLLAQQRERKRLLEEEQIKKEQRKLEDQQKQKEKPQTPKSFSQIAKPDVEQTLPPSVPLTPEPVKRERTGMSNSPRMLTSPAPEIDSRPFTEEKVPEPDAKNKPRVSQPPKISVTPLDVDSLDIDTQHNLVASSFIHCPQEEDSDDFWEYEPENPVEVPSCFPQGMSFLLVLYSLVQSALLTDPKKFQELELDTLFSMFYHYQGTCQQYLAAKELKRRAWRFHSEYHTWFLRHQQPVVAEETFEAGSYVYFDYETEWRQSIRENFKFEYKFLEDELR